MASLHDSLFFLPCRNYSDANDRVEIRGTSTLVPEMVDNFYETYSDEDDVDVDVSDGSDATDVHAVFLKYTGDLTSWRFTPSGGSGSDFTRTVPDDVDNIEGDTVSLAVDGFKHDLYLIPDTNDVSATSVRMRFTGSNVRVYALMLLEIGFSLPANETYTAMNFDNVKRVGGVGRTSGGRGSRESVLGEEREKLEYRYTALLERVKMKEFQHFMEQHLNIVFAPEFSRKPAEVYPAYWSDLRVRGRFYNAAKSMNLVDYSVAEA